MKHPFCFYVALYHTVIGAAGSLMNQGLQTNATAPASETDNAKTLTIAAAGCVPLLLTLIGLVAHRIYARLQQPRRDIRYVLCIEAPRSFSDSPAPPGRCTVGAEIIDLQCQEVQSVAAVRYECVENIFADMTAASFDADFAACLRDALAQLSLKASDMGRIAPRGLCVVLDLPAAKGDFLSSTALTTISRLISGAAKFRAMCFEGGSRRADGSVDCIVLCSRRSAACLASAILCPIETNDEVSTHVLLDLSASCTRAVMFVVRKTPGELAPEIELLSREFTCATMPRSGSAAVGVFLRDSVEPLLSDVTAHLDERGVPGARVFSIVGPGADDAALARHMEGRHLRYWLPERSLSLNGGSLVAYGAAAIARCLWHKPLHSRPGAILNRHLLALQSYQCVVEDLAEAHERISIKKQQQQHAVGKKDSSFLIAHQRGHRPATPSLFSFMTATSTQEGSDSSSAACAAEVAMRDDPSPSRSFK